MEGQQRHQLKKGPGAHDQLDVRIPVEDSTSGDPSTSQTKVLIMLIDVHVTFENVEESMLNEETRKLIQAEIKKNESEARKIEAEARKVEEEVKKIKAERFESYTRSLKNILESVLMATPIITSILQLFGVWAIEFASGSLVVQVLCPDAEKGKKFRNAVSSGEFEKLLKQTICSKDAQRLKIVAKIQNQSQKFVTKEWVQKKKKASGYEIEEVEKVKTTCKTVSRKRRIEMVSADEKTSTGEQLKEEFQSSFSETKTPSTSRFDDESAEKEESKGKKRERLSRKDSIKAKTDDEGTRPDFETVFRDLSERPEDIEKFENRYKLEERLQSVTFLVAYYSIKCRISYINNSQQQVYEKLKDILLNEVKTTVYEVSAHADKFKDIRCALFYQLAVELYLRDEVGRELATNICNVIDKMSNVCDKLLNDTEQNYWLDAMMAITSKLEAITSRYIKDDRALDKAKCLLTVAKVAKDFNQTKRSQNALKESKTFIKNTFKGRKKKPTVYGEILLEEARAHDLEFRYKESLDLYGKAAKIFQDLSNRVLLETCHTESKEVQRKIKK